MGCSKYIKKSFRDADGIRHYVYGTTLEEALIKREELKRKLKENRIEESMTLFREWAVTALNTYKPDISAKQRKNIDSRLTNYINPIIGSVPISRVTPIQCQTIMNQASGKSKSFVTALGQELRFYFDKARKNDMIIKNPAENVIRPKGYENKRRSLTPAERDAFRKVAKDRRFILFELMLYCGCRPTEAANVKYEDVVEINGIKFLHIRGTKTANSDRLVPITEESARILIKPRSRGFCALTEAHTQHNESSYRRLSDRLKREMNIAMGCKVVRNQLIEPLPLADDFVPYMFRHTYCTDLKKKGVDLRIAKDLMGHADIKTTANIYDHNDTESLMIAARLLGVAQNTGESSEFVPPKIPPENV